VRFPNKPHKSAKLPKVTQREMAEFVREQRAGLFQLGKEWRNRAKSNFINQDMGDHPEASESCAQTYLSCEAELRAILKARG
jgi:hypothetical protein